MQFIEVLLTSTFISEECSIGTHGDSHETFATMLFILVTAAEAKCHLV